MSKRYLRIGEVADLFEVTPKTVKRWWLTGKTCLEVWQPEACIGARGLRFTKDSVDRFASVRINPDEIE